MCVQHYFGRVFDKLPATLCTRQATAFASVSIVWCGVWCCVCVLRRTHLNPDNQNFSDSEGVVAAGLSLTNFKTAWLFSPSVLATYWVFRAEKGIRRGKKDIPGVAAGWKKIPCWGSKVRRGQCAWRRSEKVTLTQITRGYRVSPLNSTLCPEAPCTSTTEQNLAICT